MPVVESHAQGTPSWIDLSTTDPAAAQAFYGPLFGWQFDASPTPQGGEYVMARMDGKSAAGMMQQGPEQAQMGLPSMWNTYFTVDDVEATTAKVADAGGSVMMPPMDVMDNGRMAVIVDPTGAVSCLWQPLTHIGCEVVNEPGALIWNELVDSDGSTAAAFYSAVLGTTTTTQDMGMPEPYVLMNVGENPVAGAMAPPMDGVPNHWSVYFAVADVGASAAHAEELGGTVFAPSFEVPGVGTMAGISDPTGAMFMIMQPAAES